MKKTKIGIMGGTFNPIHNGHIALAKAAYEFCSLDEVWFMPSGVSYLKEQDEIVSGAHRLEMTRLAILNERNFYCSDFEVLRSGNTYTAETLKELHKMHKEYEFYFILGADSLFGLSKWKEPEVISKLCTLVSVVRNDVDNEELSAQKALLEEQFKAKVVLVPFDKVDISSSDIREKLLRGQSVENLLPKDVLRYIREHNLYQEELADGRA